MKGYFLINSKGTIFGIYFAGTIPVLKDASFKDFAFKKVLLLMLTFLKLVLKVLLLKDNFLKVLVLKGTFLKRFVFKDNQVELLKKPNSF